MLRSVSVSATSRSTTGSTTGSCRRAEARAADGVSRSRRRSSGSANNELRARRGSRLEPNHLLQEVQFEATVPTARDRVAQAALKLVLEPIFEADFRPCSHGFRPGRRAQDAIAEIRHLTSVRYEWVLEGDIKACFDEIDHTALMDRVRHRIGDKRVLGLVKAFLKAGVLSEDDILRDTDTGTPQGGILSPLLANIALSILDDHFVEVWQTEMATTPQRKKRRQQGRPNYRLGGFD